ncbi:MAG: hypothetical protein M1814_000084 [Vezdaea aestivalis]|nr:MAG: hypothetical protein M1814_000084 [Vezdaea aestivalis]
MRLSSLWAVCASCLLVRCIAAPVLIEEIASVEEIELVEKEAQLLKYFHEPGYDILRRHYDSRYFKDIVSYEERSVTLHHMIRAYLLFFRDRGLETWIAHGTLLGWWWNGNILPWDWDLDTQVSGATLEYMAINLNNTIHKYEPKEEEDVKRSYLLDVNPAYVERDRGDGFNIIDARWIDTSNGLYIDITGLSETNPSEEPGVWICKNYHHYSIKDLYPMRESSYVGVPAKIPYAYDRILTAEYGSQALVVTEYMNHTWNPFSKAWVKEQRVMPTEPPLPHVPVALQPRSTAPGLRNIWRVLFE